MDYNLMQKIRERPGLYLGSADKWGVYNLIFSFVKEIISESKKTNVFMEIYLDKCNTIHITCDFTSGLKNRFWLDVIEALSCDFDLQIDNEAFKLKFKPDKEVLSYDTIEYSRLLGRFTELAQLNANMKFLLENHENKNVLHFSNGLEMMLMDGVYGFGLPINTKPISIHFLKDDIEMSASLLYACFRDVTLSYVNQDRTHDGGTHVKGLYDGLLHAFQEFIRSADIQLVKTHPLFYLKERVDGEPYNFDKRTEIRKRDVIINLNFAISLTMEQPVWSSAVTRELVSEDVYTVVKQGVAECITDRLKSDPSFFYSSNVIQKAELRKIELGHGDAETVLLSY